MGIMNMWCARWHVRALQRPAGRRNQLIVVTLTWFGLIGMQDALGASYVVQRGDTLWSVSRRAQLSVDALRALNPGLGQVIYAGQVLTVPSPLPGVTPSPVTFNSAVTAPKVTAPPAELRPGQPTVKLPVVTPGAPLPFVPLPAGTAIMGPAVNVPAAGPARLVPLNDATLWAALEGLSIASRARFLMGAPYQLGGQDRSGIDCSGLTQLIYSDLGVLLPRVSADQARAGQDVLKEPWLPGDLLGFDTEGAGRVTHVAVYLGGDLMLNANSVLNAVTVEAVRRSPYWGPKVRAARRVLPEVMALRVRAEPAAVPFIGVRPEGASADAPLITSP